jgi:orotate phosphoribosyltransferase
MDEIIKIFEKSGALLNGHFRLTSGLHSPIYFQCAVVLQYPEYCHMLAAKIVNHFHKKKIDLVIAPAIGGIVIGQEVGRQLGARTIFAEREAGKLKLRRGFAMGPGENVLICEDVVTTGGSVFEVADLVRTCRANLVGVGYIVDRSNGKVDFAVDQYAVVRLDISTFSSDSCPFCLKGMPIEKPGSRNE